MTKSISASPTVKGFYDPATHTVSYVVSDPATKAAIIIDPVLDYDSKSGRTSTKSADILLDYVRENSLTVERIIETHAHADHLSSAPYLKENLGGEISIGTYIKTVQKVFGDIFNAGAGFLHDGSQFDHLFEDGDTFEVGNLKARVMHTPGHTPACCTFVVGDAAFVGDTLFMPDYGTARCDFPGGDAGTLYDSIQKIYALPDETRLFMCHDYQPGGREPAWETTVAEEKASNIHVKDSTTRSEFIAMREARDKTLDMPVLILPSIQVNMRAGNFPPEEDNHKTYLKIPVNAL
ncbi:MBL fold metallo-hydrolase [Pseudahrensia aquimaris]|uniref:MBL fold metallo-hydrolase n=1 Tax=Pseudahrensia aquimaris TaxID=744461 RepID=A0ABW3F8L4_9HYPH